MSVNDVEGSMSQLSLSAGGNGEEDWDRSMTSDSQSVPFPAQGAAADGAAGPGGASEASLGRGAGKRTLSELLKLHGEKGTEVNFSPEEASRVAEVLGQWINSSSSPYEGEDDFFSRTHAQDDSSITKRTGALEASMRPRGQSESVVTGNGQS